MPSSISYFDLSAGRFKSIPALYSTISRLLLHSSGLEVTPEKQWTLSFTGSSVDVRPQGNMTVRATIEDGHLNVTIFELERLWRLFKGWFKRVFDPRRKYLDTTTIFTMSGISWETNSEGVKTSKKDSLNLVIQGSFNILNSLAARNIFTRFIIALTSSYEEDSDLFYDSNQDSPLIENDLGTQYKQSEINDRVVTGPWNLTTVKFESEPIRIGTMSDYDLLGEGIKMLSHTHFELYTELYNSFTKHKVSFYNVLTQSRCLYKSLAIDSMARTGLYFTTREAFFPWLSLPKNKKILNEWTQNVQRRLIRHIWKDRKNEIVEMFPHISGYSKLQFDSFLAFPNYSILYIILEEYEKILEEFESIYEMGTAFLRVIITPITLYGGPNISIKTKPEVFEPNKIYSGIFVFGGHVVPILPSKHTMLNEYRVFESVEIPENSKRKFLTEAKELPYFTYDFETFQDKEEGRAGFITPYSVQLCFDGTIESSHAFIGEHCITSFFKVLIREIVKRKNQKTILYAHNGAKFDAIFIFSWLVRNLKRFNAGKNWINFLRFEPRKSIIKSGKIVSLGLTICSHRSKQRQSYEIVFRDSLQYALGSLDGLGRGYGLPIEKGTLVYEDIANFQHVNQHYEEIREYGLKDVVILHNVVSCVMQGYSNIAPNFPITGSATISGFAKKIFFDLFYKGDIVRPSDIIQNKIRPYFKGGIVQTGIQGVCRIGNPPSMENFDLETYLKTLDRGRIEDRDVTSLYPYIMTSVDMPMGDIIELNEENWPDSVLDSAMSFEPERALEMLKALGRGYFVMIEYYHIDNSIQIPFFPVYSTEHEALLRPYVHSSFPQKTLASCHELEYILEAGGLGMKIKLLKEGYMFQSKTKNKRPFEKFIRTYFKVKKDSANALKTCEPHLRSVYKSKVASAKLIINSFYGGFAMKPVGSTVAFKNDSSVLFEKTVETLISLEDLCRNDDDQIMIRYKSLISSSYVNLFIAMTITCAARVVFYKLRKKCQDNGYNFIVGDTDSGYFLADEDFEEKIVSDDPIWRQGAELGGLTTDYPNDIIIACAVVGPKVYAVELVNKVTGAVSHKIKFKGMNQNDCFGTKYEFLDELSNKTSLAFDNHYSRNWFSRKDKPNCKLTFEDFCKYATGEYDSIWINRYQMRAGIRALGTEQDEKKSACRHRITKRYGRAVKKGWLDPVEGEPLSVVMPRLLILGGDGGQFWVKKWTFK